jgi:hypothetical protein
MSVAHTGRHQLGHRSVAQQAARNRRGVLHSQSKSPMMRQQPAARHRTRQQHLECGATAAADKLEARPLQPDSFIQVRRMIIKGRPV